jgi:hypothetical protein
LIHHIVIWTLHDAGEAPRFKALLDTCAGLVPSMLSFEVGIRTPGLEANADVVLVSSFADAAALAAYQDHPQHRALAVQLGAWRRERRVLDFERP